MWVVHFLFLCYIVLAFRRLSAQHFYLCFLPFQRVNWLNPRSAGKYNVGNSEYTRFSNVLSRFETDNIVGTMKARDSIQVNDTKSLEHIL